MPEDEARRPTASADFEGLRTGASEGAEREGGAGGGIGGGGTLHVEGISIGGEGRTLGAAVGRAPPAVRALRASIHPG